MDANVLINLCQVGRLSVLSRLPGYEFAVLREVVGEIVRPDETRQVEQAVAAGWVRIDELWAVREVALYAELRRRMGAGESASLAAACARGWAVASDERRAFRREAVARLGPGRILTTPGLYLLAIRVGVLGVEEADADKAVLEGKRFRMGFGSFRELVGGG